MTTKESLPSDTGVSARYYPAEEVVDLRFLGRAIARRKWLVLVATLLGFIFGAWQVYSFVPMYEATMLVSPATSTGAPTGGGGGAGIGAVLYGLGVNFNQGSASPTFDRLTVLIGSVTLASKLQAQERMLQKLFAPTWDEESKSWISPTGWWFNFRQRVNAHFNFNPWHEPDEVTLANYMKGRIVFEESEENDFVTISFAHLDRKLALEVLQTVYFTADELLRVQDREQNEQRKEYLRTQIQTTSVIEVRNALLALLTNEERTSMLLAADLPYAGRVIQEPFVSDRKLEPDLLLLLYLPIVGAALLALVGVVLWELIRSE